jgi:serine/threonine protein kinase
MARVALALLLAAATLGDEVPPGSRFQFMGAAPLPARTPPVPTPPPLRTCSAAGTAGTAQACACSTDCNATVIWYGPTCAQRVAASDAIACGPCVTLHNARIPGLRTTWISAANGVSLFASFLVVLRLNSRNVKLALAGVESSEVITVSWYVMVLDGVMCWAVIWGVYKVFKTPEPGGGGGAAGALAWHYAASAVTRAWSAALEVFLFVLLARNGVGAWDFRVATACAALAGAVPLAQSVMNAVAGHDPTALGRGDPELDPRNLLGCSVIYFGLATFITLTAAYVSHRNARERTLRDTFPLLAAFLAATNFGVAVGYAAAYRRHAWGVCVADLTNAAYFALFAPVVYRTVRRDARYWTDPDGRDAAHIAYAFAHGARGNRPSWSEEGSGSSRSPGSTAAAAAAAAPAQAEAAQAALLPPYRAPCNMLVDNGRLAFVASLSSGSFGRVDAYIYKGHRVAIKTLRVERITAREVRLFLLTSLLPHVSTYSRLTPPSRFRSPCMSLLVNFKVRLFKNEASMFAPLAHANVVRFVGVRVNPPEIGFVMEFCDGGDLYDRLTCLRGGGDGGAAIRAAPALPPFHPLDIARQVASAMAYLQTPSAARPSVVVHRDLKSLNILLSQQPGGGDFIAKLCDFGDAVANIAPEAWRPADGDHSKTRFEHDERFHGTPAWVAPESVARAAPNLRSDVFSYGVVLWELCSWQPPFLTVPLAEKRIVDLEIAAAKVGALEKRRRQQQQQQQQQEEEEEEADEGGGGGGGSAFGKSAERADLQMTAGQGSGATTTVGSSSSRALPPAVPTSTAAESGGSNSVRFGDGSNGDGSISSEAGNSAPRLQPIRPPRAMALPGEQTVELQLTSRALAHAWVFRRGARPPLPRGLPPALEQLLVDCWKHSAEERPSFQDILERLASRELAEGQVGRDAFPFAVRGGEEEKEQTYDYIAPDVMLVGNARGLRLTNNPAAVERGGYGDGDGNGDGNAERRPYYTSEERKAEAAAASAASAASAAAAATTQGKKAKKKAKKKKKGGAAAAEDDEDILKALAPQPGRGASVPNLDRHGSAH